MTVADSARPQTSGTATVTCIVTRNPVGPVFTRRDYTATIHELEPVGHLVVNVSAPDLDGDQVFYSLVTSGVAQKPLEYFDIQPFTGEIFVTKSLYLDVQKDRNYQVAVCLSACLPAMCLLACLPTCLRRYEHIFLHVECRICNAYSFLDISI